MNGTKKRREAYRRKKLDASNKENNTYIRCLISFYIGSAVIEHSTNQAQVTFTSVETSIASDIEPHVPNDLCIY